jgi:hypothetical protein
MPNAPPKNSPIIIQDAAFGEKPPFISELFEFGNILYSEEKSYQFNEHELHTSDEGAGLP